MRPTEEEVRLELAVTVQPAVGEEAMSDRHTDVTDFMLL